MTRRGLLAATALLFASAFVADGRAQFAAGPKTLVIAVPDDPEGLDPLRTYTFGREISVNVYSRLVTSKVDLEKKSYAPDALTGDLAESWEIAPDRSAITFKIRRNATFADGTPVTAEDVVFSFKRMLALRGFQSNAGGEFGEDQHQLVDKYTARITFGAPGSKTAMTRWSLLNWWMGMSAIVSKAHVQAHATADDPWAVKYMQRNPLGSGPYKVKSWVPGEQITLEARADYWGAEKPHFTTVQYRIVPDSETRMLLLRSGQVDVVYYPSPHQMRDLANDPNLQVVSVPAAQEVVAFRMATDKPPFDDPKIRQAIIKAIPYDAIIKQTVYGYGTRIKAPIGRDGYGYKEFALYETDLKAAKELIAGSKYAGNVPSFTLVIPTRYPQRVAAAVLIQTALAELGITMEIRQLPYTAYWDRCQKDKYPVNVHTMQPFFNDALYWSYWMFHSKSPTNCTALKSDKLDEATLRSFSVPTDDKATYDGLMKTVVDDVLVGEALVAPLYQDHWNLIASRKLTGFVYWPWLSVEYARLRPAN